ncbi:MAG: LCP family protein [bacterium]|nr:LCP family protein [bacterium]
MNTNPNRYSARSSLDYTPALPPAPPPPVIDLAASEPVSLPVQAKRTEWLWVVAAAAVLLIVAVMGLVTLFAVRFNPPAEGASLDTAALPTPVDVRSAQQIAAPAFEAGSTITLADGSSLTLTPWDGTSRLTVLVMGLDRRPGESGLAYRTDTMMLISLDPAANTLGILSIPRDLYIEVPGYSRLQRANTPMVLGELQAPGYGPTLAMQTLQYNLGMRIHEVVVVDFEAFITLIDALGGLEIDVPYPIADYDYPSMDYGYDPFIIQAGRQTLDGAAALKFARTRHNDSDFERARRQQLVLFALRDQILNRDMLPSLIVQSPTLLAAISDDVYTSLTLDQIIPLALSLRDVPPENIRTGVIDANYSTDLITDQGEAVLVPLRDRLPGLLIDVFGANYAG